MNSFFCKKLYQRTQEKRSTPKKIMIYPKNVGKLSQGIQKTQKYGKNVSRI